MDYLENDDSMPAFIRDVKAYSERQFEYHSQHSAAIRELKDLNKKLCIRVNNLEKEIILIKKNL
ncbi:hypothetical protein [Prochlorococcus sp. MIT 1223]|uniref:hypothetical protein n=1 Tax=Prochlorococcus sp. MIT 1223 TaxID=3096217 RepID=UPI002A747D0E|nr:hypothetical protein [Prochlorococcus sp. MIT 1223]